MRKVIIFLLTGALMVAGCASNNSAEVSQSKSIDLSKVEDGTYTAESSRDDKLGYGRLTLTVKNHEITNAEFVGIDLFGNVKGEDYGSLISGKDSADYQKAQIAVEANKNYAGQLVEQQALEKVDAISGATISYQQFIEAAKKAVDAPKG